MVARGGKRAGWWLIAGLAVGVAAHIGTDGVARDAFADRGRRDGRGHDGPRVLSGVGRFNFATPPGTTEARPLDPPTVELVTLKDPGSVMAAFVGTLPDGAAAFLDGDGALTIRALRDDTGRAISWTRIELCGVTVTDEATGREVRGDLVISLDEIAEGTPAQAPGLLKTYRGTIRGTGGRLKGATGRIQVLGRVFVSPGMSPLNHNTYIAEIELAD